MLKIGCPPARPAVTIIQLFRLRGKKTFRQIKPLKNLQVHFRQRHQLELIYLVRMIHCEGCLPPSRILHRNRNNHCTTSSPKKCKCLYEREIWRARAPVIGRVVIFFHIPLALRAELVLSICRLGLVVQNGKLFFNNWHKCSGDAPLSAGEGKTAGALTTGS